MSNFKFKAGDEIIFPGSTPISRARVISCEPAKGDQPESYKLFWIGEKDSVQFKLHNAKAVETFYQKVVDA